MTTTITFTEADAREVLELERQLRGTHPDIAVHVVEGPLTHPGQVPEDTEVLSVFIGSRVGSAELEGLPRLRLVATRSTGVDHIDLAACTARRIAVCNVPTYGENTVAEHTFALVLALSRNVHKAWFRTRRRDFHLEGLQGFDLRGRTMGIVGTGRIGLHVAKIARGFGMDVLAHDIAPQPLLGEVIGFQYCELDDLVERSDIVSLHAPLTPSTHHLFDRERLQRCKRGALLINTARGGLVDTTALLWALDEGILRGAGLDVLEVEHVLTEDVRMLMEKAEPEQLRTLLQYQMLLDREDVVVTPHIGFDSAEAVARILEVTASNITAHLSGTPQNVVVA